MEKVKLSKKTKYKKGDRLGLTVDQYSKNQHAISFEKNVYVGVKQKINIVTVKQEIEFAKDDELFVFKEETETTKKKS